MSDKLFKCEGIKRHCEVFGIFVVTSMLLFTVYKKELGFSSKTIALPLNKSDQLLKEICFSPWIPTDNSEIFLATLSDRCSFLKTQFHFLTPNPKSSVPKLLDSFEIRQEQRRSSVRKCLKSLITFGQHSNNWNWEVPSNMRTWLNSINQIYVLMEDWSESYNLVQKKALALDVLQVQSWLNGYRELWKNGVCENVQFHECRDSENVGYLRMVDVTIRCFISQIAQGHAPVLKWDYRQFNKTPYFEPTIDPIAVSQCQSQNTPHKLSNFPIKDLIYVTDNPVAWYITSMQAFLLKPTDHLQILFQTASNKIGYNSESPIAGIHVRRGDKLERAAYQPLEKYLLLVKEFFNRCDLRGLYGKRCKRKLFIATAGETGVISEAKNLLSEDYIIITTPTEQRDKQESKMVQPLVDFRNLYKLASAKSGILLDLMFIEKTDFFVGTSSSEVTEYAQSSRTSLNPTAFESFISLDWSWSFRKDSSIQSSYNFRATSSHNMSGELHFNKGDTIWLRGFSNKVHSVEIPTKGVLWGCLKKRKAQKYCSDEGWVPDYKLELHMTEMNNVDFVWHKTEGEHEENETEFDYSEEEYLDEVEVDMTLEQLVKKRIEMNTRPKKKRTRNSLLL